MPTGKKPSSTYPLNRGLARGLAVLQAVNELGDCTALQVAKETGIPRPTVHRILESLRLVGFVDRERARDTYRLTSLVFTLSHGYASRDWVNELASPVLDALSLEFVWPTCFAMFEDGAMIVRANTHRDSPLSLTNVKPGTRFPMLTTSIGRAYLAFSPTAEREWILDLVAHTDVAKAQRQRWRAGTNKLLDGVRRSGYGLREARSGSRTASLAVPVVIGGRVLGCLGIIWMHRVLRTGDAIARFAEPMQAAAKQIAAEYRTRRFEHVRRVTRAMPSLDIENI